MHLDQQQHRVSEAKKPLKYTKHNESGPHNKGHLEFVWRLKAEDEVQCTPTIDHSRTELNPSLKKSSQHDDPQPSVFLLSPSTAHILDQVDFTFVGKEVGQESSYF